MEANNCRICERETSLLPKYDSSQGIGWVQCDECGNMSQPVDLNYGRAGIIGQWNSENPQD